MTKQRFMSLGQSPVLGFDGRQTLRLTNAVVPSIFVHTFSAKLDGLRPSSMTLQPQRLAAGGGGAGDGGMGGGGEGAGGRGGGNGGAGGEGEKRPASTGELESAALMVTRQDVSPGSQATSTS